MSKTSKHFRRRKRLFEAQNGLCHYCKQPCLMPLPNNGGQQPPNFATIEHLQDTHHPNGRSNKAETLVMACFKCNQERNRQAFKAKMGPIRYRIVLLLHWLLNKIKR